MKENAVWYTYLMESVTTFVYNVFFQRVPIFQTISTLQVIILIAHRPCNLIVGFQSKMSLPFVWIKFPLSSLVGSYWFLLILLLFFFSLVSIIFHIMTCSSHLLYMQAGYRTTTHKLCVCFVHMFSFILFFHRVFMNSIEERMLTMVNVHLASMNQVYSLHSAAFHSSG